MTIMASACNSRLLTIKASNSYFQSSNEMLMALIRNLGTMELEKNDSLISQSKVLVISSNVPTRLFSQWSFRVLNLPASRLEEYETSESIENLVSN